MTMATEIASRLREEFLSIARQHPDAGPRELSRMFPHVTYSTIHKWLTRDRQKGSGMGVTTRPERTRDRLQFHIENGSVVVFSDAHFWPGMRSTAFRGLLRVIERLRPKAVVGNGDLFDGASISRHPRIGWEQRPNVRQELAACIERTGEIEAVARSAKLLMTPGNHDSRFNTCLSASAPQFEGIAGFNLADHFPKWDYGWGVWVNDDTVIKHRWKGGVHAARNNALNSGRTTVTGHLHSLKVTPVTDFNGTRWGVDTGMLADPRGPQFQSYTESGVTDWRSGFVVLTYSNGRLLWPQIAHVISDKEIDFKGEVIRV